MPKFTRKIENDRPLIYVVICSEIDEFKKITENSDLDKLEQYKFLALVDTGATASTISPEVVETLDLEPIGKVEVLSASHKVTVNKYNIILSIPAEEIKEFQTDTGETELGLQLVFSTHDIEVSEMNTHTQGIDMLLGMDILKHCLLVFNSGEFTFSF